MNLRPLMYLAIGCTLALPLSAHAAGGAEVTGAFAETVTVFGMDHQRIGQVPARDLVGHAIVGRDPSSGMLKVSTDKGVVLVKRLSVKTNITGAPPPETACVKIGPGSIDQAGGISNNLGSGCHGS